MRFEKLQSKMAVRPWFRPQDLHNGRPPRSHEQVQLSRWAKQGKVIRLRRGLYTMGPDFRRNDLSPLSIAEAIYRPSYLSLEWSLSHYGLLPEAAGTFTSVTPLKTARFLNPLGNFVYRHLDIRFFFGFFRSDRPAPHWIAWPEKALLDWIHLSVPRKEVLTEDFLLDGYRLQNLDILRRQRLRECIRRFDTPRVREGGTLLLSLCRRAG